MPDNERQKIVDSILATVGNTPIVRLNALSPPGVNVFAKLEAFNPMGSVKDRLALGFPRRVGREYVPQVPCGARGCRGGRLGKQRGRCR